LAERFAGEQHDDPGGDCEKRLDEDDAALLQLDHAGRRGLSCSWGMPVTMMAGKSLHWCVQSWCRSS
jgi:hypothetical protein